MFLCEWKKLLFYRKGLVLILVFLLAELLGVCLTTKPYDKELETNRAVYDGYLSHVEGLLTPENRQWLEDEMLRLNIAKMELERLKTNYYSGNITEGEFREKFDILAAENADYPGFSKLYTQYIYVRETPQRYFLYTGGWEVLFGNQEPDYLYLLLLIFLITPIFCQEYGNQMDQILLTQKRSAKHQWQTKVGVALVATAALTAILQMFELGYCAICFGLPHWDYSLQSLYSFGTVQKEMNLWQAFALQFALKELGYLYVTLLLLCISVLVKKYAFALMAGMVILPIPFLTVNTNMVFLNIPGPWALTIGSIYLNGDGSRFSGNTIEAVREVPWSELGQAVGVVAVIFVAMLLCIRHKNTNYHVRKRHTKALPAVLAVMLLLTGCGNETEDIHYNSKHANCFESDRYVIFEAFLKDPIVFDKQTGEYYDFPMDAFQGETAVSGDYFYYEKGALYYMKAEQQYLTGSSESAANHYALVALDLKTMKETVVYRWNQMPQWFFGLLDKDSVEPGPHYVNDFFLYDGDLYYDYNGELYVMDLQSGRYELYIDPPNSTNLAYDGANIYYTDPYNRLVIQNIATGNTQVLEQVVAKDFILTPEGIYFLNIQDNSTLYYWDGESKASKKLDDTKAFDLYWDESYCWIDTMDGLYRLNHDGNNKTKVECPGFVCCITTSSAMYMMDYVDEILYSVNKDTLEWERITQ